MAKAPTEKNPIAEDTVLVEFGDFFRYERERKTPSPNGSHPSAYWWKHWWAAFSAGIASTLLVEAVIHWLF